MVLVTSGTITSSARDTVDDLRKSGQRIGLIKIKMFRSFPSDEIAALLSPYEKVAVIDRNLSAGNGGIFAAEIKSALYNRKKRPALLSGRI